MSNGIHEWFYYDEEASDWSGPFSMVELDAKYQNGQIQDFTEVCNRHVGRHLGPMSRGVEYGRLSRVNVDFVPSVAEFLNTRNASPVTVLCGPNNCGKTLFLKSIFLELGQGSYLVSCNRFSHVNILNTRAIDDSAHRHIYSDFSQNFYSNGQNSEDNTLPLEQLLTGLNNRQRTKLFELCSELLGNRFSLKRIDEENEFSPYYVDMDGENLRLGSSGTRLLITLLGIILDERFTSLLIDEPEIGLSPRIQTILAKFLFDERRRKQFCPHLQRIVIATHSHLFLDRFVMGNNYVLAKSAKRVTVTPISTVADFHHLQFNLLGNDMEAFFLPDAMIIVEGDSDHTFLSRLLQLHLPNRKVAVVRANGEGEVRSKLHFFKEAFGDINTSPFQWRLFVVLDKQISVSVGKIEQDGVPKDNIIVLTQNGIEYYYPHCLVAEVFHAAEVEIKDWKFEKDPMEWNGVRKSKKELARLIADRLTTAHITHPELSVLLEKVENACA